MSLSSFVEDFKIDVDALSRIKKRVFVVGRVVIRHAGRAAVDVGAAQVLGRHLFTGRGFDQWRTGQKDRALVPDDN